MKKKLLSFILAMFCLFTLVGCSPNNPPPADPPTNAELAVIYKEVADSAWEKVGVENPTQTVNPLSTILDFKTETTDEAQIANIKINANGMAGLLYMLGLLYENENFVTTNGIAVFDANISIMGTDAVQNYVLTSTIDQENNKLYLEAVVTTMGNKQYSYLDADYNFEEKELIAFRFCSSLGEFAFVDMALTEDNKNMWYETNDSTSDYAVSLLAKRAEFEASAEGIEKLTANFDEEVQVYMTILESEIGGIE